MIDMGSIKLINKNIKCDYYLCDDENDNLKDFFQKACNYESEKYFDGYPDNCILCKNKTTDATYNHINLFMSLGKSYCLKCEIRYSKADKVWKCCKIENKNEKIYLCSNKLSDVNNYICENPSHILNNKLTLLYDNSDLEDFNAKKKYMLAQKNINQYNFNILI